MVPIAAKGHYSGAPRPAVVVQADQLRGRDSVLVALTTGELVDAPFYRLEIMPTDVNNLKERTQIQVDKILAIPRNKCGPVFGRLTDAELLALNGRLATILGLAG